MENFNKNVFHSTKDGKIILVNMPSKHLHNMERIGLKKKADLEIPAVTCF